MRFFPSPNRENSGVLGLARKECHISLFNSPLINAPLEDAPELFIAKRFNIRRKCGVLRAPNERIEPKTVASHSVRKRQ